MDYSKRTSVLFLFCIILFSTGIIYTCADSGKNDDQGNASPQEILRDTYNLFSKVSLQYWENVKSLINQAQLQFTPPDLDFRSKEGRGGAKEKVKDAAGKSFEMSKEAVEETAKIAANVVGEAAHETAEKLKDKVPMPANDHVHQEL